MKYTKNEIEQLKQLDNLMNFRIKQLMQIYTYNWWEESLKDPCYTSLCKVYAAIKTDAYIRTERDKPIRVVSQEELQKMLINNVSAQELLNL